MSKYSSTGFGITPYSLDPPLRAWPLRHAPDKVLRPFILRFLLGLKVPEPEFPDKDSGHHGNRERQQDAQQPEGRAEQRYGPYRQRRMHGGGFCMIRGVMGYASTCSMAR